MEFDGFDIRFSVVELCDYLMNNFKIPEETVHLLQVEQVDGRTLLDLNDDELQMVGFKTLGLRKSIQRLILQFKNVHDTMRMQKKCHFQDLTDLVGKDAPGKEALSQLEKDGFFNTVNQQLFVNRCTDILVEKGIEMGFARNYPTREMKIKMAESIVESFPQLKYNRDGSAGFEHFYDPIKGGGYLENRLKTMRKRMSPEGKAYKKRRNATKRKNESDTESSSGMSESSGSNDIRMLLSDLKEKKKILQNFVPSVANKMEIFALTDETFQLRRQDVELDKLSMTEFLKEYPRFSDVNEGILFEREFELMHPEAKSLSLVLDEKFCRAVEKVAQIRLTNITSSNITENKLHTIHMLEKLLPPLNLRRKGYQSAQSHAIFQFAGAGTDPTNFAVHKDPGLTQPFLLAVGNKSQPDQYYIVADFAVIYVGNDVVRALYRLFCLFWVCNISYYPRLAPFYNLLEVLVINKTPVCSVKTVLAAINAVENTACTVD